MARIFTEHDVTRRLRQGFGAGHGASYKPWLQIRHVPSSGKSTLLPGRKTGRLHVMLSGIETHAFLAAEWRDDVCDVREQFPLLPVPETVEIAAGLGVRHPRGGKPSGSMVMTTDLLLSVRGDAGTEELAIAVKPSSELCTPRTLELLEVERLYWRRRSVPWCLVTEREVGGVIGLNLLWFSSRYHLSVEDAAPADIRRVEELLGGMPDRMAAHPVGETCAFADDRLGLRPGCALNVLRHVLARKWWGVDITMPLGASHPLPGFRRGPIPVGPGLPA